MSEVQLDTEEQDIYETIRAGITEGQTTFEQARWVIDNLKDAGYTITRAPVTNASEDVREAVERCQRNENYDSDHPTEWAQFRISDVKALIRGIEEASIQKQIDAAWMKDARQQYKELAALKQRQPEEVTVDGAMERMKDYLQVPLVEEALLFVAENNLHIVQERTA